MRVAPEGRRSPIATFLRLLAATLLLWALVCPAQTNTSRYIYDDLGRLIAATDPSGVTTVYTYDAAGNLVSVSRRSSTEVSIISFTPDHGVVGATVTAFGSGFVANPAANTLTFAGTPATVTAATATSLVATVPAGAVTGPIAVNNANGSASSSVPFTVIALPVITGVSPGLVPRGFITRLQISGTNLRFATGVTFSQAGMTANLLPGATDQLLNVELRVSPSVPAGSYGFSVANAVGSTASGSVTVNVTIPPTGDTVTPALPLSVFVPAPAQAAPSGSSASVASPISVFAPAAAQVAPSGASTSVAAPVSVFASPPSQVAPSGSATSVTAPVSVSMP